MNTKTFSEMFPVLKIEQDCILSRRGDITLAYQVELPEIFTQSVSELADAHLLWTKAIRLLPVGSIIHKQDWYTQLQYQADFSDTSASFLSSANQLHFHERKWLDHHCYLYLTLRSVGHKRTLSASPVPAPCLDATRVTNFFEKAQQFVAVLAESPFFQCKRLTAAQLGSSYQDAGLIERYCYLIPEGAPQMMRDVEFRPSLRIGQQHCRYFSMADAADLPPACSPAMQYDKYSSEAAKFSIGFASPLAQLLDCNHIYNQYILLDDPAAVLTHLERKRKRLESLSTHSRENTIAKDAVSRFLNEAIGEQRLPVKSHFNLLTWSEDPVAATRIKDKVSAAMAKMDIRCKEETISTAHLYLSGIPGAAALLPPAEQFDTFTEQAVCFFTAETNYRSSMSDRGVRLGERISGLPVKVDLIHEPLARGWAANRSFFVLGPSGTGKSFLTNHLMRSMWEQGSHVFIIDVGHSYQGLCEFAEGYYFSFSPDKPIAFNPFVLDGPLDTEKKESIKALLLTLWKKDNEPYTRAEYISLSNALTAYYEHVTTTGEFPCFNSFYAFLQGTFADQLRAQGIKAKDFDIDNFLYVLRPYATGGEFDYLLNATENLDLLHQRFVVFELDNIANHEILFSVTTIILMDAFISKMRKLSGVHKVILIEEAWKSIVRAGMGEYIQYLYKTVRKFYGSAGTVSQEADDMIASPIVKHTIINNSDIKILLDQSKYQNRFTDIQNLLGLTDKDKSLVLSMNKANDPALKYKEVFISIGTAVSKVYRTEVSLEEYLTYTTEETEKVKVRAYRQRYGSMRKAIQMLARDMRQAS